MVGRRCLCGSVPDGGSSRIISSILVLLVLVAVVVVLGLELESMG